MQLIQGWMQRLRTALIAHLRPGRDRQELLAVLARAEALHSDAERNMLEKMIEFQEMRVRELMVPRSKIHAVSVDDQLADIEQLMLARGVSRVPVMDGDIDHVLGVVHVRDVIAARRRGETPPIKQLLRPCLRVLELELVSGLLPEMRAHACQIALVLDEYGGTAGLITLPDLVHEIIGEIGEDGQPEDDELHPLHDGRFVVQASMHIEELAEALARPLPEGDYDTVGGWLTAHLGRIPKHGERLEIDGMQVQILEADPRRIVKVAIRPLPQ